MCTLATCCDISVTTVIHLLRNTKVYVVPVVLSVHSGQLPVATRIAGSKVMLAKTGRERPVFMNGTTSAKECGAFDYISPSQQDIKKERCGHL